MLKSPANLKYLCVLLFTLLLTSCDLGFFCTTETYTYVDTVPIYLQPEEINKIESLSPQDIVSPGKIYLHGTYIFINELDKGIHVIDNSDRTKPKNLAFIAIPGNHDLLVRQDETKIILFADNYTNLVSIDITNPEAITVLKRIENIFNNFYPQPVDNEEGILVGYEEGEVKTDSYRNCSGIAYSPPVPEAAPSTPTSGASQGGSLARFAAIEDFLYTIDLDAIQSFKIDDLANPVVFNRVNVDFGIETLFPYYRETGNQLYVGGNQGMYIMDASDPGNLREQGRISHIQSCDPVVVQDDLAYVTLQGSCFGQSNRLEVIDVTNPGSPKVITEYALQEPFGLGIDDDYLFVCDGMAGLKVYENARAPKELKLIKQLDEVKARDIIPYQGNAIVIAENGFFQYDYSNLVNGEMTLLSSILVSQANAEEP